MEVDDPIPPTHQCRDRTWAKQGDDPRPPPRKETSTPQASRYKGTSKPTPSTKGKGRMTEADLITQDLSERQAQLSDLLACLQKMDIDPSLGDFME